MCTQMLALAGGIGKCRERDVAVLWLRLRHETCLIELHQGRAFRRLNVLRSAVRRFVDERNRVGDVALDAPPGSHLYECGAKCCLGT